MSDPESPDGYRQLEQAIAALEAQRGVLGNAVVDPMLAAAREKLEALRPAGPISPDLHGERRQATILLADVQGSTELAEHVDTETWVEIMDRVFHLLGDAIYRYGGEIEQYRGDGLMAFFGAKAAHEDDPERAVRAALAMQEAAKAYAAELKAERGVELLLRVGVNTGEVIAAHVGDDRQHSEDTAMGRAIALAARMESAAQPGTVLVTADTYHLTRPLFEWQALGEIAVKGVSQPVTVYRPLAARTIEGKGRGIEGLSSPLVGRDRELAALQQAIANLQRGMGGIVTLVGEAGIGKSRLVAEVRIQTLAKVAQGSRDPSQGLAVQWVEGRCLSYGSSIAYLLWLDMFRNVLRVAPDAPPAVVGDALRAWVQALCPDCFDAVYPYLCKLLALPLEDEYATIRDLQGESLRAEVFWAVQRLVESAARQQPLVMVCEDLHWADPTSLALLERVLALTDRVALLLICIFRPEVEHGCWQLKEMAARLYRHRHTDLWLDALSADESQELVGHLLRVEDLPAALRTKILSQAEGNPFYVEEILRTLIDDGAIVCDDAEHWCATREIADIPIPDTLHGVLMARIDHLEDETRRVLRLASVIGRVFLYRVLVEIVPSPPPPLPKVEGSSTLDTRLLTLQRQQLIRERARVPELEYIFKHELTREAAYNGLLKRERRVYHRQVAEALERLFPERADELAGLLAYHWEQAEELGKAVEYLLRAGEQARLAYANEEASDHFQRALSLMQVVPPALDRREQRLTALSGLGKVLFGVGRIPEAEEPLREAISLAKEMGLVPRDLVRLYWWLAEVLYWQGRYDDEMHVAEQGLALLGTDALSVEAALMVEHIAVSLSGQGDSLRYKEVALRMAQFVGRLPFVEELRPAYVHIVLAYMGEKNVSAAAMWIEALEEKAHCHHDLRALAEARMYTAVLLRRKGDLYGAIPEFEQARDLFQRIGDAKHVYWVLRDLGDCYLALGALDQAESYARLGLETASTLGSLTQLAIAHWLAGRVLLCRGRTEDAIDALREAARLDREGGGTLIQAGSGLLLGRACLAQGHRRTAREHLEQAIALTESWVFDAAAIYMLGDLEAAYEDLESFRCFCQQHRERHPEIKDPMCAHFVQWYLEPVAVREMHTMPWRDDFAGLSPGWVWEDPFGDCSFTAQDGLEIHAASGRSLWRCNASAPRLLRAVSPGRPAQGAVQDNATGRDLAVQTICVPAAEDKPVSGGLVVWRDEQNYLCLSIGERGRYEITFRGSVENQDTIVGRGRLDGADRVFLRLEATGDRVAACCSTDGERWFTVGHVRFPTEGPIQVGVFATVGILHDVFRDYPPLPVSDLQSPQGTAIRFESFQMWE